MQQQQQGQQPQKYVEFKLRSTSSASYLHNVMTLAGPSVNISDFTTPVRLIRDPSISVRGDAAAEANSEEGASGAMSRRKKKTRLILPEDEEQEELQSSERAPWLLEDFDGQHSYISSLITPESRYVIFVNQGNEFRVLQASKWYKFSPKLSYVPLTLEEAEEKMANKGKNEDFDRWLMRKRHTGSSSNESSGTASVRPPAATSAAAEPTVLRVAKRLVNLEEEGFDFSEFVDDDDGEDLYPGAADEDDPSAPRMERAPRSMKKNLTDAGRQVKRLMRNLDGGNQMYTMDDSDDEEGRDPYAGEEEAEESEEAVQEREEKLRYQQRLQQLQLQQQQQQKPKPQPTPLQTQRSLDSLSPKSLSAVAAARSRSKSPSNVIRSRSKSPTVQQPASMTKVPTTNAVPASSSALTEAEIVTILAKDGPMRTKDLIGRVKAKLKADPQNKDVFREIVRKVATVRPTTNEDEDKLLELKAEFRP